jgi:hypothetical protein
MSIHLRQIIAVSAVVVFGASGSALAESDAPGVTDFSAANAEAIEMEDITSALAVPRGTRIEPSAPPTVRVELINLGSVE